MQRLQHDGRARGEEAQHPVLADLVADRRADATAQGERRGVEGAAVLGHPQERGAQGTTREQRVDRVRAEQAGVVHALGRAGQKGPRPQCCSANVARSIETSEASPWPPAGEEEATGRLGGGVVTARRRPRRRPHRRARRDTPGRRRRCRPGPRPRRPLRRRARRERPASPAPLSAGPSVPPPAPPSAPPSCSPGRPGSPAPLSAGPSALPSLPSPSGSGSMVLSLMAPHLPLGRHLRRRGASFQQPRPTARGLCDRRQVPVRRGMPRAGRAIATGATVTASPTAATMGAWPSTSSCPRCATSSRATSPSTCCRTPCSTPSRRG